MSNFKNPPESALNYPLIFSSICAVPVLGTLFYGVLYPEDFKALGNWGDFFGGLVTPILTFATVVGLLYTIKLQRDELSLTREELFRSATALESQHREMKTQSFESRFFNMLEFHASIVSQLHMNEYRSDHNGRDVFNILYEILRGSYIRNFHDKNLPDSSKFDVDIYYDEYWLTASDIIGHYYRYLFNLIRFVANNSNDAETYIKLIRAQITDKELVLLLYNSRSRHGSNFLKFIADFSLFDNLRQDLLFNTDHKDFIGPSIYG